jgi:hypothetical protein
MSSSASIKRQLIYASITPLLILLLHLLFSYSSSTVTAYRQYIFLPLQQLRGRVFGLFPYSVGDIFYIVITIALLIALCRFMVGCFSFRRNKLLLFIALLRSVQLLFKVYLLLFILWGGNYFQESISDHLQLDKEVQITTKDLVAFDSLLIGRLNYCATNYKNLSMVEINEEAAQGYAATAAFPRAKVKPSLFGNMMAYMGVEGYFNPITGEAQINAHTPAFMQPFVIAHEMAHQTGVAAEDDANLMAYIQCLQSADVSFHYSAYLNIWLYAHRTVRRVDSTVAKRLRAQLNQLTINHIDILRQLRRKYDSRMGDYSSNIYDAYLKLGNQKQGVESYKNVAFSALAWERKCGRLQHIDFDTLSKK